MPRLRTFQAETSEVFAEILGLSNADGGECQVQYSPVARLKTIARKEKLTHSRHLPIHILGWLGYRVHVSVPRVRSAS
jgi:hypothetical protein